MNTKLLGLATMMAVAVGCAHGAPGQGRDVRGSARISQQARALVVGPAHLVHATGERPVRWFVADRVTGGDQDCLRASQSEALLAESVSAHLTVTPGHVLCAAVAGGSTDVNWHQLAENNTNMWALR
jgi:hypothetical protein